MSNADETPSPVTILNDFNGVPGLVVDAQGGAVSPSMAAVESVPDALALTAKSLLEMRDAMLEIPNIGDWCIYGPADVGLLQLFPNGARLRNPEVRADSAERVMGWLKGDWRRNGYTGRAAKVRIADRDCIVILHNVDGLVTKEPAAPEAVAQAEKGAAPDA